MGVTNELDRNSLLDHLGRRSRCAHPPLEVAAMNAARCPLCNCFVICSCGGCKTVTCENVCIHESSSGTLSAISGKLQESPHVSGKKLPRYPTLDELDGDWK
jgi:hypothetical protein